MGHSPLQISRHHHSRGPEKSSASASITPSATPNTKTAPTRPNTRASSFDFPAPFVGHGEPICRPPESLQFDYEGEIVIVIGKAGRRIPERHAHDHIFGLTLMNEGSVRDWLRHGKFNVTQGKNFDRSGAIGPHIVTRDAAGRT